MISENFRSRKLSELLLAESLECSVCLGRVLKADKIFNCSVCFSILHLHCLSKWAHSTSTDAVRCPNCSCPITTSTDKYTCFCGFKENPKFSQKSPHSCGLMCRKQLRTCDHKCQYDCHPGPCNPCDKVRPAVCFCGKLKFNQRCAEKKRQISCGDICLKPLSCGVHFCNQECHEGECNACLFILKMDCACAKHRSIYKTCGTGISQTINYQNVQFFLCDELCEKLLPCANHFCEQNCHLGKCLECLFSTRTNNTCGCGKTNLLVPRISCLEPIPSCGQLCGKILQCTHSCKSKCHQEIDCPPCPGTQILNCRCNSTSDKYQCSTILENQLRISYEQWTPTCESVCFTLRDCGKHQCNTRCCPSRNLENIHPCPLVCNRQLSCGNHQCQNLCHKGTCNYCLEATFDEVSCACGQTTIYPPIPCGTNITSITCPFPCLRTPTDCTHPAPPHKCHNGPCPPCLYLIPTACVGGTHIVDVPCFKRHDKVICENSCGKRKKKWNCSHGCAMTCHYGPCQEICTAKCGKVVCQIGHICEAKCGHSGKCYGEEKCEMSCIVSCGKECGKTSNITMECWKVFEDKFLFVSSLSKGKGTIKEILVDCSQSVFLPCSKTRRSKYVTERLWDEVSASGVIPRSSHRRVSVLIFLDCPRNKEIKSFLTSIVAQNVRFEFLMKRPYDDEEVEKTVSNIKPSTTQFQNFVVKFNEVLEIGLLSKILYRREDMILAISGAPLPPTIKAPEIESKRIVNERPEKEEIVASFNLLEVCEQPFPDDNVDPPTEIFFGPDLEPISDQLKKKKKKKKVARVKEIEVEKVVEKIEDSTVGSLIDHKKCSFKKCLTKPAMFDMGFCKYCERKYCMAHRIPDVHSELCAKLIKEQTKTSYTQESNRAIDLNKRRDGNERIEKLIQKSGGDLVKAAEKEKEEAKKRLREKILAARKKPSAK